MIKRIHALPFIWIMLFLSGCGGCHRLDNATISGLILDSGTHRPIPFAFVERKGFNGSATHADSNGYFFYSEHRTFSSGDSISLEYSNDGYADKNRTYPIFANIAASYDTIFLTPLHGH